MEDVRTHQQWVVSVEFLLWRECIVLVRSIESQPKHALLASLASKLVQESHTSIGLIGKNAEGKHAHFTYNEVGRVEVLTDV